MEPSRLKLLQMSLPSPAGFQRLQRWMRTPGWGAVAMHHCPCPSAIGSERSPLSSTPLSPSSSTQRLCCPWVRPMAGT
jgi:hypothetical protein